MRTPFLIFAVIAFSSTAGGHENHHHHAGDSHKEEPLHLIPIRGDSPLDEKIRQHQRRLEADGKNAALIENLGWLFVSKARMESQHEPYAHAVQCAEELGKSPEWRHQSQLLLGHVYLQEHKFDAAKRVASTLVEERGLHYDQGLLGDVLFDLGDSEGAIVAYQEMMRQRPGLESFARAGLVRWLRGQVDGAIEAMELAVSAGSRRSPEPLAWAYTKLAGYHLQNGDYERVAKITDEAMGLVPGYPHALLLRGRLHLAQGQAERAVPYLRQAAEALPEPAFLWALRDALQLVGETGEASRIEEQLHQTGADLDPRTYALFLATTGQRLGEAIALCRKELSQRQDPFTHDALAWSLSALGESENTSECNRVMLQALREGTLDARLSLHAGLIALRQADLDGASKHLATADRYRATLLPSERKLLNAGREKLATRS